MNTQTATNIDLRTAKLLRRIKSIADDSNNIAFSAHAQK